MSTPLNTTVLRLLPSPAETVPLRGLYLAHDLRSEISPADVHCYSNFVVSLDGRISMAPSPTGGFSGVPPNLSSAGDWRLFQELVAQSDAIVVSGRYVREVASGRSQPLVHLGRPGMEDLIEWRRNRELPDVPDIVILSSRLDLDPTAAHRLAPRVTVVTGAQSPPERAARLRGAGIEVVIAGSGTGVDGSRLYQAIAHLEYRAIYAAAGPVVFHLLASSGLVDRLYVTTVNRLLGGSPFAAMTQGDAFRPTVDLRLDALYIDEESHPDVSQLFAMYRAQSTPTAK